MEIVLIRHLDTGRLHFRRSVGFEPLCGYEGRFTDCSIYAPIIASALCRSCWNRVGELIRETGTNGSGTNG